MPRRLKACIDDALNSAGLSIKRFSAWVSESVVRLEQTERFWEFVSEEQMSSTETVSRTISLTPEAVQALDSIAKVTRDHFPPDKHPEMLEIRSKIIRTAILQRLLHSPQS
tara:strand:+ start:67 stop:399 length:333 start_codon:yes stop_codon:yes gene_type:complete